MAISSSMGAAKLDVRYGDRFTLPYYNGMLSSTAISSNSTACRAGRVYSLTTGGYLVPGLINSATTDANAGSMPFFGMTGLDANNYPDTQRDAGMPSFGSSPASGTDMFDRFNGFNGLPAVGNYAGPFATIRHNAAVELVTTEFDTSLSYAVGAPLTALRYNATTASQAGRIRTVSAGTDHIIGYVAPAGKFTGPEGYSMLAFTPAYVIGSTAPAA